MTRSWAAPRRSRAILFLMKARVRNGRLVLDEPTDLPEGAEIELVPADADELDEDERARLHAALDRADNEAAAGHLHPADEVLAELDTRIESCRSASFRAHENSSGRSSRG